MNSISGEKRNHCNILISGGGRAAGLSSKPQGLGPEEGSLSMPQVEPCSVFPQQTLLGSPLDQAFCP